MNADRPPLTPVPCLRRTEPSAALIPKAGQARLPAYVGADHFARSLLPPAQPPTGSALIVPLHPSWRRNP